MDIQGLINDYAEWLKKEITFSKMGEYYEITSPFLDVNNDYLQIYVRMDHNEILFTDDGATIQKLKMNGFKVTANRKKQIRGVLSQYGVELSKNDEIVSKAPASTFAQKKHMFIQALMRIDDMISFTKPYIFSNFQDNVANFLDKKDIYYTDNVQFTGKSGYTHTYDFLLQRTSAKPERMCCAVNNPDRSQLSNILFAWEDTKPTRKKESQLIVILNDDSGISPSVETGFQNYDVKTIPWSKRENEDNLKLLSAG